MQVKVTCLGDRDTGVAAAQLGDERPDDGPLLLERADVAKQHVERQARLRTSCALGLARPAGPRPRGFSRISNVSMTSSILMSL